MAKVAKPEDEAALDFPAHLLQVDSHQDGYHHENDKIGNISLLISSQVDKGVLCSKLTSRVIVTRYFDQSILSSDNISARDDLGANDDGPNQI